MIIEKRYHVLGLTPKEQLTLRYLLFNAYSAWVDKVIKEASSYTSEEQSEKASYTYKLFCRYNDISGLLTTDEQIRKAKPVCLILNPEAIRFIEIATKGFDEKYHLLSASHLERAKSCYQEVKEKVFESVKHSYTQKEINEAQRK